MTLDKPICDAYGVVTIAEFGGWFVQIAPMIFNDRVVLTPKTVPWVYDYGWCYPKGGCAALAVMAWEPETEAEPPGYIKAVGGTRQAGEVCQIL